MNKVQPNNYYTVQGWMLSLGLTLREISALAIVYGFSQDNDSEFKGSISYIQEWLGCSKQTAIDTMSSLVEKGYIIKRQENISGVVFNRYIVDAEKIRLVVQKLDRGCQEIRQGVVQKLDSPSNNKYINNNIYISPINPPKGECECEVVEEVDSNEMKFEEFRKMYKGTKRGHDKEWQNFVKKYKKRIDEIIPILIPSYEAQLKYRDDSRRNGCFVPQEQNMQTWINNEGWSYELHFEQQTRPGTQQGADWNTHEGLQRQHQVDELTQKLWDSI